MCNTNFSPSEKPGSLLFVWQYVIRLGREGRDLHSKFDWQMPNKFSAHAVALGIVIRICQTTLTGPTVRNSSRHTIQYHKGFHKILVVF